MVAWVVLRQFAVTVLAVAVTQELFKSLHAGHCIRGCVVVTSRHRGRGRHDRGRGAGQRRYGCL